MTWNKYVEKSSASTTDLFETLKMLKTVIICGCGFTVSHLLRSLTNQLNGNLFLFLMSVAELPSYVIITYFNLSKISNENNCQCSVKS